MPCDQIVTCRVSLPQMDPALRDAAIRAMGGRMLNANTFTYNGQSYAIQNGELVSRGSDTGEVADLLKRAYSGEVVKYAAKRAGWAVKQVGQFQYQIIRR